MMKDSWGQRERAKGRSQTMQLNNPTAYKPLLPVLWIHFMQWFFHAKCIIYSWCWKTKQSKRKQNTQNWEESQTVSQAPHCLFPLSGFLKSSVFSAQWLQHWAEVLWSSLKREQLPFPSDLRPCPRMSSCGFESLQAVLGLPSWMRFLRSKK